ncbi:histone-like nucleoid-structuring protein Lsr2 [Umezawaea tangerina]|uniref:Lsr2 protein n=1 Tax=Umezawaea tangerina TaxID=84725 RepID=A0A2T0STK6_9PSEU|nr:Lsr2 family protein [Umezawaea tangerina]PRY36728.1 Lsr2 protein [Umezawaea tangerina]
MAHRTVTEFVDDLDGGPAQETVDFGLDGVHYAIDLSEDNAARLRAVFAVFIRHGRRTTSARRRAPAARSSVDEQDRNQQIRSWAREAGFTLRDRGRIPAEITALFRAERG